VTPAGRDAFARCRRQCDLGAQGRRNLVPLAPPGAEGPDLGRAVREALDIYYFPACGTGSAGSPSRSSCRGWTGRWPASANSIDAADGQAWQHRLAAGRDPLDCHHSSQSR
jgi:hypothetical protein